MKKLMVFILSSVFVLCLSGCSKESTSIGIIGGADGPTAMFVTSQINWPSVCGLIGAIVVTILIIRIIHHNKKKK